MTRRNGVTLVEVLIAIFVMGIGLLAILSLFPLGAAQMAQAIRDQRAAECAGNAGALSRVIWKQVCDEKLTSEDIAFRFRESGSPPKYTRSFQPFMNALDDPNFIDIPGAANPNPTKYPNVANWPATVPNPPRLQPPYPVSATSTPRTFDDMVSLPVSGPGADQSSYPVFVDPFGWVAHGNANNRNAQWWLPTKAIPGIPKVGAIPRRPIFQKSPPPAGTGAWTEVISPATIYREFGLTDDITFKQDGTPDNAVTAPLQRQGRYTWSYLFRRVRNDGIFNREQVDVTVVVYAGRSLAVASPETAYLADGANNTKLLTITVPATGTHPNAGQKRPAVRRGSWVLDATIFDGVGTIMPQGQFYRVVNVEEGANGSGQPQYFLELQTPLAFVTPPPPPANTPSQRIIVVMENVIEVFLKGEINRNSSPTTY